MSDFWHGKRVLVTGAAGFIGSHLVEALLEQGAAVRAFVRYTSRADTGLLRLLSAEMQESIDVVAGDLRDPHAVEQAVAGCEYVFHLGALIAIPYSYVHPVETASTNVTGTINVLTACRTHGVKRLIHTSTSEVYGTALRIPIDESHPLQPQSPYSASKIGADALVESYYRSFDLPAIIVRPFNTYGPRQSARAVIPTIITQALTQPVVRLGNLDARRDFTYARDTVSGFLAAAVADESSLGRAYNLGMGKDISIGELANEVIRQVNPNISVEIDKARLRPTKSEVMRLISDNRLAKEALGWEPKYTFATGLGETIAWIERHLHLFRVGKYEV